MDFSRIQDFDMQLLHVFNGSENVWLDQMAMALTSGWTWIPLYIVLFVVVIRNNEMMGQIALVVGGAVLCIFLADGLVDGIIKPLAERCRPSSDPMFKYTVQVVDNMRLKSFSFCSAHAANTLSLAIFFSLLIRSKLVTWTLLLWSLVNCWTRLYLGVHYPVDILCGLAIGAVVGVVGRSFTARVEHLDDYHFDMGGLGNVFHICQFAEVMERNHADGNLRFPRYDGHGREFRYVDLS